MVLKSLPLNVTAAAVLAALALAWGSTSPVYAQTYMPQGPADLSANYYVEPAGPGIGAEMYICPRPVPPWVGYTYITYQPLMPHQFLYHHKCCYVTRGPCGVTHTHVHWGSSDLGQDLRHFFIGENTKIHKKGLSQTILKNGPN